MIKVSVRLITYNQEQYIAQAIESALEQQTDFDYEIVIGDDFSTDSTAEIAREYQARYPEKVRVLHRDCHLGRLQNFGDTLRNCTGEYVALLDGDDYWTDPHKLQKQVDFLEVHPECSICFHGYEVHYEDGSKPPRLSPPPPGDITSLEDLLVCDYIGNVTVMFRRIEAQELPGWYYELAIGDWPLHILNAQYGDIGYIDSVMAVWRVHGGGMWQSWNRVRRVNIELEMFQHLRSHLDARYQRAVRASIARRYLALAAVCADDGDIGQARVNLWKSIAESPSGGLRWPADLAALALRLYAPPLHRALKRLLRPSAGSA